MFVDEVETAGSESKGGLTVPFSKPLLFVDADSLPVSREVLLLLEFSAEDDAGATAVLDGKLDCDPRGVPGAAGLSD